MEKNGKTGDEFLEREMIRNWEYYIRLLDERKTIFDYFFRVIAIPAGIIGIISIFGDKVLDGSQRRISSEAFRSLISFSLLPVALASISSYIYYCIETRNSRFYVKAFLEMRDILSKRYHLPDYPCVYVNVKDQVLISVGSAALWRGMVMSTISSAILAGLINSFLYEYNIISLFVQYILFVALHILIFLLLVVAPKVSRKNSRADSGGR